MKQKGASPLQQGSFYVFKTFRLLSSLIAFFTILICFLSLGALNQTLATTYYVDNTITDTYPASATPDCTNYNTSTYACSGGSDSAYKTIADINAGSFSGDDQILFRKGQTWSEQLTVPSSGTSGHPITFGAFGSGNKPIINGSDLISGWTNYSGNVWQATVTTQTYIVIFDGSVGVAQTGIGNLTTNNDWYWSSNTLYIYSTSDPAGKTIEAGQRDSAIVGFSKNYITVQNLTLRGSNGRTLRDSSGNYWTIQNNTVELTSTGAAGNGGSIAVSFSRGLKSNGTEMYDSYVSV